jgi:flagellar protein FlaG
MSSQVMTEGILIVVSVISASILGGIVITQVGIFDSHYTNTVNIQKDIMLTKTKIIHAINSTDTEANVWIKNIGSQSLSNLDTMDVFFGKNNEAQRITYQAGSNPSWTIQNNTSLWNPSETIQIVITNNASFESGIYSVIITAPNGVQAETVMSMT